MLYRVMVRGEDGMVFCAVNDVPEDEVGKMIDKAIDMWPDSLAIWSEEEEWTVMPREWRSGNF